MLHTSTLARSAVALTAALTLSTITALSGAEPASAQPVPPPARDAPAPEPARDVLDDLRRPWLYAADPTTPPPAHVVTSLSVGYAATNRASRPFAGNVANAGAVFGASAEVGIFRFLSLRAEGLLEGEGSKVSAGAMIGPNFSVRLPRIPISLGVSGGYLRELGGGNGLWARAAIAGDLGRARFIFTALGEHVFAPPGAGMVEKRDAIDLILTAGATYALTEVLGLGTEYVVQDLEGAWDPEEAEGGIRHFLGPVAALKIARHVQLTAGPAFGLSKGAPAVLGRLSAMYAF